MHAIRSCPRCSLQKPEDGYPASLRWESCQKGFPELCKSHSSAIVRCLQEAAGAEMNMAPIEAQLEHLLEAVSQQVLVLLPSRADELLEGSSIAVVCALVLQFLPCLRLVVRSATEINAKGSLQKAQVSLARATSSLADAIRQFLKLSDKEQTEHVIRAAGLEPLVLQHPECKSLLTKLCNSQRKTLERLLPSLK